MKEVQKRSSKEVQTIDLNLTIYFLIKSGMKAIDICSKLNIKKSLLSYYLRKLRLDGYIKKVGYGTWEVTKDLKTKEVQSSIGWSESFIKCSRIRGHAFILTFKIPKLKNWDKREQYLKSKGIQYRKIHNSILRIIFLNHKVWLCNKTIVIYSPKETSYYSQEAIESEGEAILNMIGIMDALGKLLNTSLKTAQGYKFKVSKHHFGRISDSLAIFCQKRQLKLSIKLKEGWFLIDNSFQLHEAETQGIGAIRYMDNHYTPFIKSLMETPFTVDEFTALKEEVSEAFIKQSQIMDGIQENQMIFDRNLQSHIKAVKDLGTGVNNLNEGINELKDIIKKLKEG